MNLLFTEVWHWNKGKNRTVPGGDCLVKKENIALSMMEALNWGRLMEESGVQVGQSQGWTGTSPSIAPKTWSMLLGG